MKDMKETKVRWSWIIRKLTEYTSRKFLLTIWIMWTALDLFVRGIIKNEWVFLIMFLLPAFFFMYTNGKIKTSEMKFKIGPEGAEISGKGGGDVPKN